MPAQLRLKRAFAEGRVAREIIVFTLAPLPSGMIAEGIVLESCDEVHGPTQMISERNMSWEVEGEPVQRFYRLCLRLLQGRPRDARQALADLGTPVIGDVLNHSTIKLRDAHSGRSTNAFFISRLIVV